MQKFFKQKNKAFTLIETLVAISIFTVSILGLLSILASGVSNTNYAKKKIAATYLAQEGIEYARNVRDTNVLSSANGWTTFKNLSDANITPPAPDDTGFERTVSKSPIGTTGDEVQITSNVIWHQGSGVYNITFSENLFNWVEQL